MVRWFRYRRRRRVYYRRRRTYRTKRLQKSLFEAIMDHRLIIEINTKKWITDERFFPHQRYFEMLKRSDAPIVFNSDAHYPDLINSGRFEAMDAYRQA